MKLRNTLVLVFALLLIGQLFIRENFREPYPMIVLPAGTPVYEHEEDTITTTQRKAIAYADTKDSLEVPRRVLFPESPAHFHGGMYSSLRQADTSSEQWANAAQWIQRNIATRMSLTEVDSLCIRRVQKKIPVGEGDSESSYKRSLCYKLPDSR